MKGGRKLRQSKLDDRAGIVVMKSVESECVKWKKMGCGCGFEFG